MRRLRLVLFILWIISGVLWYETSRIEVPTLERRPQAELNQIADDLLKSMMEDNHDIR